MAGEVEGYDERSRLRISDADRHRVSELLRAAAGEGRLDISELDERLEATYAAKTYADLVPLTADLPFGAQQSLPVASPTAMQPNVPATRYDTSASVMGSTSRRGVWEIGAAHNAVAVMGSVLIDLREVRFSSRETVIRAFACWGSVDVYVNAQTRVVVDGIGVMGSFEQSRDKVEPALGPDSPVVRITGLALMGAVTVKRRAQPGEPGEPRRRRIGL